MRDFMSIHAEIVRNRLVIVRQAANLAVTLDVATGGCSTSGGYDPIQSKHAGSEARSARDAEQQV